MTQLEVYSLYLNGALLCFIIEPAVNRAEKIWKNRPIEKIDGIFVKETGAKIGMSMCWPLMLPLGLYLWFYYSLNILIWTSLSEKKHKARIKSDKKSREESRKRDDKVISELLNEIKNTDEVISELLNEIKKPPPK